MLIATPALATSPSCPSSRLVEAIWPSSLEHSLSSSAKAVTIALLWIAQVSNAASGLPSPCHLIEKSPMPP